MFRKSSLMKRRKKSKKIWSSQAKHTNTLKYHILSSSNYSKKSICFKVNDSDPKQERMVHIVTINIRIVQNLSSLFSVEWVSKTAWLFVKELTRLSLVRWVSFFVFPHSQISVNRWADAWLSCSLQCWLISSKLFTNSLFFSSR